MTPYQQKLCEMRSAGASHAEIAETLGISVSGVQYHFCKIGLEIGIKRNNPVDFYSKYQRWKAAQPPRDIHSHG